MNLVLQRVDDNELIRRIDSAESSVALYTPGVGFSVAQALHRAALRLGGAVKVVWDVSQKSVDMGYLEPAAVEMIWKLQRDIGISSFYHLSGLRLGSLFVDDGRALVFAPIAKLMEDECAEQVMRCPSGLNVVEGDCAIDVREMPLVLVDEALVAKICDLNLRPAKTLSEIKAECEQKVKTAQGQAKAAEERAVEAERRAQEAENRAVDEYKGQFKIRKVKFTVHSQPTAIERKRATIPSMFLVGLGNEAEKKLIANYRLFPEEEEIEAYITKKYPEENIAKFAEMEKEIRDKYILRVTGFGLYVRTKDQQAFDEAIKRLKAFGTTVGKHIREALGAKIDAAIERLYKLLEGQWKQSRDPWFAEYCKKHPERSRDRYEIFVSEMKSGANGTDALVEKFAPKIVSFSTPIDEALALNDEFKSALGKMLWKRNRIEGNERITIDDLIALKPQKSGSCGDGGVPMNGTEAKDGI